MIGVRESDRCYFCGGKLEARIAMLPFVVGNSVIIIKQIPADVCTQCGEAVMSSDVAKKVDHLLKQARKSCFEVSVLSYQSPELAMA
jgi:YgiT-type zinc finger domain-containing protein